ncbi:hypothetical protein BDQ17DRAFT_1328588 [Cyathus striatus]|nr:hypothetical protein BDQ17DRAFT_1328588 [Cyathus striatus]
MSIPSISVTEAHTAAGAPHLVQFILGRIRKNYRDWLVRSPSCRMRESVRDEAEMKRSRWKSGTTPGYPPFGVNFTSLAMYLLAHTVQLLLDSIASLAAHRWRESRPGMVYAEGPNYWARSRAIAKD